MSHATERMQARADADPTIDAPTGTNIGGGLVGRLTRPVDIAPLVYIRVLFGAVMLWEVCRYFSHGWIERYFIRPEILFRYFGFDWVRPWGGDGMYAHFALLGALAVCMVIGWRYRVTAALFFVGFAYVFLLDQARYLNHFYLVVLVSFLLASLPAHGALSLDAKRDPAIRRDTVPAWMLWLLRIQLGIPYLYGGIAKINGDWLRGEPMRMWLRERTDFPLIGHLFAEEWTVYAFSYGGMLLDLLAVPMLLWRRTRVPAVVMLATFHIVNAQLFTIGIFPWLMLAATVVFFPPDSLRRWAAKLGARVRPITPRPAASGGRHPGLVLASLFVALQLLVPFRHLLYPGEVSWTEEGHRFSWHMKLRDKDGTVRLVATDGERRWTYSPRELLASHQRNRLVDGPDMILQLAHHVHNRLAAQGHRNVKVYAVVHASLNGRRPQLLVDPAVDLVRVKRSLLPARWIMPLTTPLDARAPGAHGHADIE